METEKPKIVVDPNELFQPHKFKINENGRYVPDRLEPYRSFWVKNEEVLYLRPTQRFPQGIYVYRNGEEVAVDKLRALGLKPVDEMQSENDNYAD